MTEEEVRAEALRFRRSEKALLALFAVIVGVLLWFVGCRVVPFEPYRSYSYEAVPEKVCVGDTVTLSAERSVDGMYPVEKVVYDSEWRPAGGQPPDYPEGFPQDAEDGELPLSPAPRERVKSRAPRTVPTVPGDWTLVTDYVVEGSVGGIAREQRLTVETDGEVVVLAASAAFCRAGASQEQEGVVEGA